MLEHVQWTSGVSGFGGNRFSRQFQPLLIKSRQIIGKVDRAARHEDQRQQNQLFIQTSGSQHIIVCRDECIIGTAKHQAWIQPLQIGVFGRVQTPAQGKIRIVDPQPFVRPEHPGHGNGVAADAFPAGMDIAADPHGTDRGIPVAEMIIAAEQFRPSRHAAADRIHQQPQDPAARHAAVVKTFRRHGRSEKIQFEIFISHPGITGKEIRQEIL